MTQRHAGCVQHDNSIRRTMLESEILLQKFLEENALSAKKKKKAHASCAMVLELGAAVP